MIFFALWGSLWGCETECDGVGCENILTASKLILIFGEENYPSGEFTTASYDQVRQPIYHGSIGRWRNYGEHLRPLAAALMRQNIDVEQ